MTAESMKAKGEATKAKIEKALTTRPAHPEALGKKAKVAEWNARTILKKLVADGKAEMVKKGHLKLYRKASGLLVIT